VSNNSAARPDQEGATLSLRRLAVSRGGTRVLIVDSLDVPAGQVTVVIGPNGSGKSTLLGVLQLLIKPDAGELLIDGEPMRDDALATRRRMASVFQEALLLNTTVQKNVVTALGIHKVPKKERGPRAARWLERFGVGHLASRHAHALSGGEAQRVSLARAFALEPEVLLLDEPFSALDAPTRAALIDDFAATVSETPVTTVLVTHDRDEALRLANQVVVLIGGRVHQVGSPGDVFGAPADEDVASFVGIENVWPATLVDSKSGVARYRLSACSRCELEVATAVAPQRALFAIRPEEITVSAGGAEAQTSARNRLQAVVRQVRPAGAVVRLILEMDGDPPIGVVAAVTRPSLDDLDIDVGSAVTIAFKATAAHVIPHD
jgi:tungstate transport system ATP-binding protein